MVMEKIEFLTNHTPPDNAFLMDKSQTEFRGGWEWEFPGC